MSTGVRSFEDLRVFLEARSLTEQIWMTRSRPLCSDKVLIGQLRRASLSIVSNIAEGFERGSRAEFGRFLRSRRDRAAKFGPKCSLRRI